MNHIRNCYRCGNPCKSKLQPPFCGPCQHARGSCRNKGGSLFRWATTSTGPHAIRDYDDGWGVAYCSPAPITCGKPSMRTTAPGDCRSCQRAIKRVGKDHPLTRKSSYDKTRA